MAIPILVLIETGELTREALVLIETGELTCEALLERCLDGADPDRKQGWRDYVSAVVDAAQ